MLVSPFDFVTNAEVSSISVVLLLPLPPAPPPDQSFFIMDFSEDVAEHVVLVVLAAKGLALILPIEWERVTQTLEFPKSIACVVVLSIVILCLIS